MNRINRRRFVAVTSVAATSAVLVACGNEQMDDDQLNPTQIPDVPGAPPTIAPLTATPGAAEQTTEGTAETGTDGAPAEAVVIEGFDDFSYTPSELDVSPGQVLTFRCAGFAGHDLVVDEWGINTAVLMNEEEEEFTIPEDAEIGQQVQFYCSVVGHRQNGMEGTFTVVEASGDAAAATTGEEEAPAEGDATAEDAAGTDGAPAEAVVIEGFDDFSFTPSEVDVTPGQVLTFRCAGYAGHDLVVDEWGIQTAVLMNAQEEEFTIPEDAEVGTQVAFYCSVVGHRQNGMEGTFTVVEASGDAAAATTGEEEAPAEGDATAEDAAATDGAPAEAVVIEGFDDFSYTPSEVDVTPGQVLTFRCAGYAGHDLVVDEWGIQTAVLMNAQEEEFTIPEDAEVGTQVPFYCSVVGHRQNGMEGTFTVVEGSGDAAATTTGEEEAPAEGEATAAAEETTAEATAAASPAATESTPMHVTLTGTKWQFDPAEFEIAPSGTITFQNNTGMTMGLSADEWNENALQPMIKSVTDGNSADFVVPDDAEVGSQIEIRSTLTEAARQGMVCTATIVDAADAGSGDATAEASTGAADSGNGETVVIEGYDDFSFSPDAVDVTPGQVLKFVCAGYAGHDLVVDEWEIQTAILMNGQEEEFTIPEDAEVGTEVKFYCSVVGHRQNGMEGTFTVV